MTTPIDVFGPGIAIVTRTDVANSTPVNIGYAQSLSIDFSGSIKELYGQNQYPIDAARGTVKVSGKMVSAVVSGLAWNSIFFGQNMAAGGYNWNPSEAGTIPASPFQVTVSNAAYFEKDLGVTFTTTGLPLIKVASAPATGQYSVAGTGIYTFAAADTGKGVLITYTNTRQVAAGQTLSVNNALLGTSPIFQLDYYTSRNVGPFVLRLYQCQATKLTFATKLEDFALPEFDFSAFANSAGNVASIVWPEVA